MNHDRPIDKTTVYASAGEVISFTGGLFVAHDVSPNDAEITALRHALEEVRAELSKERPQP